MMWYSFSLHAPITTDAVFQTHGSLILPCWLPVSRNPFGCTTGKFCNICDEAHRKLHLNRYICKGKLRKECNLLEIRQVKCS